MFGVKASVAACYLSAQSDTCPDALPYGLVTSAIVTIKGCVGSWKFPSQDMGAILDSHKCHSAMKVLFDPFLLLL